MFLKGSSAYKVGLAIFFVLVCATVLFTTRNHDTQSKERLKAKSLHLDVADNLPEAVVQLTSLPEKADLNCKMYSCFDVYRCGVNEEHSNRISVYLHPLHRFLDGNGDPIVNSITKEFYELYSAIASSPFYTDDPKMACLFIPPVDLLSQYGMNSLKMGKLLASLPNWNHGLNHLLFNMIPGVPPDYSTVLDVPHGKAIVAGGGFSYWTYRTKFDVSIPVLNSLAVYSKDPVDSISGAFRRWFLISSQMNIHSEYRTILGGLAPKNHDFLLLEKCRNVPDDKPVNSMRCRGAEENNFPEILQEGVFCLILPTARLGQPLLTDAIHSGCIPVFACDTYVLPFSEVLDWTRASVSIQEESLPNVLSILRKITPSQINRMKLQIDFFRENYFNSMTTVAMTTLQIINDRIFPQSAKTYNDWNTPVTSGAVETPLFLPLMSPKQDGFTAVILAYDRVQSLFQLISSIDKVPSLRMILVVWNNQQKPFPARNEWPIIDHEWKVIQTKANKLSNRFYPFQEIQTEAVLAIDDDIIMLTPDEIEFGFQVWREFPDRLVGFPPRLHLWTADNHHVRYESEWKNNISIVLTGAAFYHKYFNYLYTYKMPGDIRDWVDDHMNCEDIAMNFIISNYTGNAPIKVTPRKKFKCSECATGGSLSLDESHMVERSTCMNHFMEIYGTLPLKSVNFRADPVLYKDDFPDKLKAFPNIGSL